MTEMAPCPFCRATEDLIDDFTSGGYRWMHVRCRCGAMGPGVPIDYTDHDANRVLARAAWNRIPDGYVSAATAYDLRVMGDTVSARTIWKNSAPDHDVPIYIGAPASGEPSGAEAVVRHDCGEWRDEGLGCAECNPIARAVRGDVERSSLRRIAALGMDCPPSMERADFYRDQLQAAIGLAARTVSMWPTAPGAPEEGAGE